MAPGLSRFDEPARAIRRGANTHFGEQRQRGERLLGRDQLAQIVEADANRFGDTKMSKRGEHVFLVVGVGQFFVERALEPGRCRARPALVGAHERVEELGMTDEMLGEIRARREQAYEDFHRRRRAAEQREVARVRAGTDQEVDEAIDRRLGVGGIERRSQQTRGHALDGAPPLGARRPGDAPSIEPAKTLDRPRTVAKPHLLEKRRGLVALAALDHPEERDGDRIERHAGRRRAFLGLELEKP